MTRIPLYAGVLITITDTFVFLFLDKYGTVTSLTLHLTLLLLHTFMQLAFLSRLEKTRGFLWLSHYRDGDKFWL